MSSNPAKPLWQQFAAMTLAQAQNEQAVDAARINSGQMDEDEAEERATAWQRVAAYRRGQTDLLKKIDRLARATGCPKNMARVRWLVAKGLLIKTGGGYKFTADAVAAPRASK